MSPSNRRNDNVAIKRSSSSSCSSMGESSTSTGVVTKMLHSPLTTIKKIVRPTARGYLPTLRRTNELQLDNNEHLSGLMYLPSSGQPSELQLDNGRYLSGMVLHGKPSIIDDIDQSFASDFDESVRWLKQIR